MDACIIVVKSADAAFSSSLLVRCCFGHGVGHAYSTKNFIMVEKYNHVAHGLRAGPEPARSMVSLDMFVVVITTVVIRAVCLAVKAMANALVELDVRLRFHEQES
jgi:hypothetical protein